MDLSHHQDMNFFHRVSRLRSLYTTLASLLTMSLIMGPAQAQGPGRTDPGTLRSANKVFATADADMNGSLSKNEASVAGIPEREFTARDKDKSATWSGEEFLPYYYNLLLNSGKKPDKELQNEVARIEAVRRAQEAEELRRAQERLRKMREKDTAEAAQDGATGDVESIEQKLKRAREALKDRSKRAGADRDAYENTAGELAERARGAAGSTEDQSGGASDNDWAGKLRRARAALQRRARDGRWSREQLDAADRRLIERARAAQQGVDLTQLPASVRSKYERALVALTDRAQAGSWSREQYEAELADVLSRAKEELNDRGGDGSGVGSGPGGGADGSDGELTQARRDYERALAALDERAQAGGWTRERHEAERAELARRLQIRESNDGGGSTGSDQGQASSTRNTVERAQEELNNRARRADMSREEHARINDQLLERARKSLQSVTAGTNPDVRTKYERALTALIKRAQEAGMTRAAFENERDQLLERARQEAGFTMATQEDYDQARKALIENLKGAVSDTRLKHGRAMIALISRAQKAGMTRVAFEHERDQLIERARQEVQAAVANQADFDKSQKKFEDVLGGASSDIRTKYQRALNALISRAQSAGMTRAAFENERDQLIERARREAGATGGADDGGGAGGPEVRSRRVETKDPVGRELKPLPVKTQPKRPTEKPKTREKDGSSKVN